MGQARGPEPAPRPHWLASGVRPEPGTRVPIHCHHPSSQPSPYTVPTYLPSPPLPPPSSLGALGAGEDCSPSGAGRRSSRGRLELNSTLAVSGGKRRRGRGGEESEARERARLRPCRSRAERGGGRAGVARAKPSGSSGTGNAAAAAGSAARPPAPLRARSSAVRASAPRAAVASPSPTLAPGRGLRSQPASSSSSPRLGSCETGRDSGVLSAAPEAAEARSRERAREPPPGRPLLLPSGVESVPPVSGCWASGPTRTPYPGPRPPCHAAQSGDGSPGTGSVAWGTGADAGKHAR